LQEKLAEKVMTLKNFSKLGSKQKFVKYQLTMKSTCLFILSIKDAIQ